MSEERKRRLMLSVNRSVFEERLRQIELYGHQQKTWGEWLMVLMEEVGEATQAMQADTEQYKATDADDLETELIQVAAVASKMAEKAREEKLMELRDKEANYEL